MNSNIRRVLISNLLDNMEILHCSHDTQILSSIILNKDITDYIVNKTHLILISIGINNNSTVSDNSTRYEVPLTIPAEPWAYNSNGYYYNDIYGIQYNGSLNHKKFDIEYHPSKLKLSINSLTTYTGSALIVAIPVTT